MQNINDVAKKTGILEEELENFGRDKAKISLNLLKRLEHKQNGKLILVTAINPTPAGEGKTTISIGLAQGLNEIGENPVLALREPSLGPVFGLKGGATGGGKSIIVPEEAINLHFTGDLHAITSAHNLLSAVIDNHIYQGNTLKIDRVIWKRALDMNDRALRSIETKFRKDGFMITAASEIMAILALAKDLEDLKKRINRILIGYTEDKKSLYVKDIGCADAMVLLLKEAIKPNLVQTIDGIPAFVHAGPFANIAHGCNSINATKMALKLGDYAITEAGFGADLGMEKFLNLKVPYLPKAPDLIVLVATIRALKSHGHANDFNKEDLNALKEGIPHLEKHIENIKNFGLNYVIALNHFSGDSDNEIEYMKRWAKDNHHDLAFADGFINGAKGMVELAKLVKQKVNIESHFKPTYSKELSTKEKIEKVATSIYGASSVSFSKRALEQLETYENNGWALPVCMAKTHLSLSGDKNLIGRPKDFILEISSVKPSLGAGFFVALTKGIMTMPGLNKIPRALKMKVDQNGELI
jgi:formate--tetrahydrofolate ligase